MNIKQAIKSELRKAKQAELEARYTDNVIAGYINVGRVRALQDLIKTINTAHSA